MRTETTKLRHDLDAMSERMELESVARANASVEFNVCQTQMYADADAKKAVEDYRAVLHEEVVKLRESVSKRTDFDDKCAVVLNNYGSLGVFLGL